MAHTHTLDDDDGIDDDDDLYIAPYSLHRENHTSKALYIGNDTELN